MSRMEGDADDNMLFDLYLPAANSKTSSSAIAIQHGVDVPTSSFQSDLQTPHKSPDGLVMNGNVFQPDMRTPSRKGSFDPTNQNSLLEVPSWRRDRSVSSTLVGK